MATQHPTQYVGDYHDYHECAGNSYDNHSFFLLFDMKERFSKARSADVLRRHRVADLLVFRSPFEGLAPTAQSRVSWNHQAVPSFFHGKELLLESMLTAWTAQRWKTWEEKGSCLVVSHFLFHPYFLMMMMIIIIVTIIVVIIIITFIVVVYMTR